MQAASKLDLLLRGLSLGQKLSHELRIPCSVFNQTGHG